MAKRILTLNQISVRGLERLPRERYEIASEFTNPDAILLRSHKLGAADIADSVLAIARAGAGTNNIPVDACTQRGIPVFNSPGANANAVKELVAAGLLLGSRGIIDGVDYVAGLRGISDAAALNQALEANKKRFKGNELQGKTLGVVGLGAIGSLVADMALTLGMDVIGYDPALSVDAAWRLSSQVRKADTLSMVFARSDYVTLHLPALESTRGLVSAELLQAMPADSCLLNFARQEIVDEDALLAALERGGLRKYIADFPSPALIGRKDVILMPHIGASTDEAEDNCAIMAADQLRDFLENGNIRNAVNFPTLQLERAGTCRLAITNSNVPRILGSVLAILAELDINVVDMLNKSRDELAYNLIDIDRAPTADSLAKMQALDGVINVRHIA
ncbi:3-phosphoglycerate dehydrogenase [Kineobactrum sediminis]|uniref:D-3-phosphoglycerate dehydrogenase n=1 Tax=Kineobactrum sediminis TaxID=1905677 RepID=A0A2N5Y156_9GAMM|nr:phosphoglycerate dehydrogenase [Kineobactrum sediminis]PLW82124.1 3-phosphoglycerate dehydrogenase [Kineobactrum sediminis]